MDPRPFTFRILYAGWLAKQRSEWAQVGVTVAWFVAVNGKNIHPNKIIPALFRLPEPPKPKKSKAEIEMESRLAWGLVRKVFKLPPSKKKKGE